MASQVKNSSQAVLGSVPQIQEIMGKRPKHDLFGRDVIDLWYYTSY